MKIEIPHCNTERDFSCESPRVDYSDGGRYFRVSFKRSPGMEWNQEQFYRHDSKRGVCRGFTFGSRRRMLDRLNQVSVGADLPDFVTLTLPDDCFDDSVSRFAKTAKLHLSVLLKRLHRVCPSATGFWRIEWKARKSGLHEGKLFPHFHLLVWGLGSRPTIVGADGVQQFESFVPVHDKQNELSGLSAKVCAVHEFKSKRAGEKFLLRMGAAEMWREAFGDGHVRSYLSFYDWVSVAWYHVVGTGNLDHFLAGCRVEHIRTWGGVLSYCAKYMSKSDSEIFCRTWRLVGRGGFSIVKICRGQR